jgi:orotidine-5'-phosphate decarboxylase
MAKLILALDRQSWELAPPETDDVDLYNAWDLHDTIDSYLHSGVDGIKLTAASLFNGVYDSLYGGYRNYKSQFRYGKYYGNKLPFPNIDIFMDLKIADISFGDNKGTNYKIVNAVAKGTKGFITHVNVHGFVGSRGLREVVSGGRDEGLKILVLCALTDESYDTAYHIDREGTLAAYENTIDARDAGAYGVILPSNRLDYITYGIQQLNIPIWSPGFGRQNKIGDIYAQLKAWRDLVGDNPENAAIVGTHLLDHPDLVNEVKKIKEIIK